MFKNLVDFTGFETLGTVTTVFFFLLFVGVIVWVFFLKKKIRFENGATSPRI